MTEKPVRYPLSFSPHNLRGGLFVEINFFNVHPNLKKAFFIAFNLDSKFASCPVTATDITRVGFILTITDVEEIAVVLLVEGEVRVTRILPLAVNI